ncbi:mrr restriction system protein [Arenibacter sp. NBRC 103722]|uniref:restriction endonuclease n=1 Tax=Arenibacter sp. NBRC 103722 TaxID=1113929 RepID=UPI0008539B63|nr:restriction endonuclease [Arenibacter sp. NBRC 103722]GBF18219.1 mrr restriction system protein [Arenibacter sp. NBRC 103722]
MSHIPENPNTDISPTEFEKLIYDYLSNLGKDLNSFQSTHNLLIEKPDGNYQIDVYAEFNVFGGQIKVLIECKKYKNSVKREIVQLLYDKLRATGAHKGMIFSTSGFQSGAIKFAEVHGIALVKVFDGKLNYSTKSGTSEPISLPDWIDFAKYQGEFTYGNSINYLQVGHLDAMESFIFGNKGSG